MVTGNPEVGDVPPVLYDRIGPLVKSGELLASPRGFEPRYLP
jgi:hypothetical protein